MYRWLNWFFNHGNLKKIKAQILKYSLSCVKTDVSARLYLHAQLWGPQSLAHCVHWIPTVSTWAGARYWIYLLFTCVLLKGVPQKIRFYFYWVGCHQLCTKGDVNQKRLLKKFDNSQYWNQLIDLESIPSHRCCGDSNPFLSSYGFKIVHFCTSITFS